MSRSVVLVMFFSTSLHAQDAFVSRGFLKLPEGVKLGAVSAVAIDAKDHVYVLHRGEPPLLAFDGDHRYLRGWGEKLFKVPHGLRVDSEGNVWTTDNGNHVVRQFSSQGKLLRTIGELGFAGADKNRFRSPDDVVFSSKGDLFVADAGNARIVHLSPDGKYLGQWGKKGKGDGEFALAHSLAMDGADRIYVGDRGNKRVQLFDLAGKHLATWTGFGEAYGVHSLGKDLIVAEGEKHLLFVLRDGKLSGSWGGPKLLELPHLMAHDSRGRLFVAEVNGKRLQILEKK